MRASTRRSAALLTAAFLAAGVLVGGGGPPAAAVAPPESCALDPAVGANGVAYAQAPDDGYVLDRMELDAQGRLYTINIRIVDESYALDRVRRFRRDGSLDTSFGNNGSADLPGRAFAGTGRVLAIDDRGRVWVARNTYSNVRQVLRLTPDGTLDTSLPEIELFEPANRFDFIGAMTTSGGSAILAHGINDSNESYGSVERVVITDDGAVSETNSSVVPGRMVFVSAVDPSGWVTGNLRTGDTPFAFVWWQEGSAQVFHIESVASAYSDVIVDGDGALAVGTVGDSNAFSAATVRVPEDAFGAAEPIPGVTAVSSLPGAGATSLFDDGTLVGFEGSELFVGTVATDGGIVTDRTVAIADGIGAYPSPNRLTVDGGRVAAGYTDVRNRAFIVGLTPELGPPAVDGALADQVERLYLAYYQRVPDAAGSGFWEARRAAGQSLRSMSDQFSATPEFVDLYGTLSDREFVELVYRNVLGRAGESDGVDFWTAELAAGRRSRGSVMLEFSESSENVARTDTVAAHDGPTGQVYRLYRAYFGRGPDAGGSCFWVRRMAGGVSLSQVSASFAASPEFVETYGALSNREFVELLYDNVLERAGDVDGIAFWTDQLDQRLTTRGRVMIGFSESAEYLQRTGTLPAD